MRPNRTLSLLAVVAMVATLILGSCGSKGDKTTTATKDDKTTTTKAEEGSEKTTTTEGDDDSEPTTTESDGGGDGGGDIGDLSADEQAFVAAMVDAMTAEEDFPLSEEQATCFAARTIRTIGVDTMKASGATPDSIRDPNSDSMDFSEFKLTEAQANDVYDNFGRGDIDLREAMLTSMSADGEMTPAQKTCMETVLSEENLRKFMVGMMMSGEDNLENDPELSEITGGIMGCAFMGMGPAMGESDGMGEDTSTTAAP